MNPTQLKKALVTEAFHPFNLHYPSGKVYAVRSPNQDRLTSDLRTIVIMQPASLDESGFDMLDVIMAERLEVLNEDPMPPHRWLRDRPGDGPKSAFEGGDAA